MLAPSPSSPSPSHSTHPQRRKLTFHDFNTAGGCGQAFTTLIVSPEFAGKNSLKRHRLVNAALKNEIAQIHAWSAKCQTQEEYDKEMVVTGGHDSPPLDGTEGGKVTGVKE